MCFWRWLRIVLDKFWNVWELGLDILEVALYILKVAVDILGIAVDILEVALDILEIALDILEIALDILEIALALWQTKRPTPLLKYIYITNIYIYYDMYPTTVADIFRKRAKASWLQARVSPWRSLGKMVGLVHKNPTGWEGWKKTVSFIGYLHMLKPRSSRATGPSLKLTAESTWKLMVGIRILLSFWGPALFSGTFAVSGRVDQLLIWINCPSVKLKVVRSLNPFFCRFQWDFGVHHKHLVTW